MQIKLQLDIAIHAKAMAGSGNDNSAKLGERMESNESIWSRLADHSIIDWDARFNGGVQLIGTPINSHSYFSQRMEVAVGLLTTIHAELRVDVRRIYEQCKAPNDLEDPQALAEVVLAKALGRCIQTIQSQLTEGQTDELLDHAALDNCAHDNIQSAHTHHARIALLIASELEQRRQLLLALGSTGNFPPRKHSVCLIHGIRTRAEWAERTASTLRKSDPSIRAVPLRYGFFDAVRFLLPWSWARNRPVRRITRLLRDEIARKPDQVSVIAHSFGTYILAKILESTLENTSDIKFHRVILCGSIIPDDFPWENYSHRLDSDLEESWHAVCDCGMRDIWPVLAASATWGYGSSGRFGFGHGRVKDRFFDYGHSDFFSEEHVRKQWLPYLSAGVVVDGVLSRATTPWWVSVLTVVKVRYLVASILAFTFAAGLAASVLLIRDAMKQDGMYLDRPNLYLGMSWREYSNATKDTKSEIEAAPGITAASYSGVFWNLPAQIKHEFVDGRLATTLITIKAEECDAIMYDASSKPIGTASGQCGLGPTTIDATSACQTIKEKYRALVIATGGPVDRLENRYAAEQWLMGEIIKQHSGNGWQQQWPAGGKNDSARLERFKVSETTFVQFQLVEWRWDYWTIDPSRQPDPNARLSAPFPSPMSDHYNRFGCFLQYRLSTKSNFDWDLQERRY